MNAVEITSDALSRAFGDLVAGMVSFVPLLILALIVFVIGWLISVGVGRLVTDILKRIKFNQVFERGNWKQALERAELKVDPSAFVGGIFKWVLAIVFLMVAVSVLGFDGLDNFINSVLAYVPRVIVAALILVVAIIISDILQKIVRAGMETTGIGHARIIGSLVRWFILVFAIIAALLQLQIAQVPLEALVGSFFQNLFLGLAAAFAIAFGLGGKDMAADILRQVKNKIEK